MICQVFAALLVVLCSASYERPKQYVIPYAKTNWIGALEYCSRRNMRLAIITNSTENQLVLDEIHSVQANSMTALSNVWIGASDNLQEGSFVWHETGEPVQYTSWAPGQPDNKWSNEDCVEIAYRWYTRWSWAWNDRQCTNEQNFICESHAERSNIRMPQEQQHQQDSLG
nr:perlucin-like [Aedes albopictus]